MANLFQNLQKQAFQAGITPRSKESVAWFQNKIRDMKSPNRRKLMNEDPIELRNRQALGSMYMYFYDPKHKETLPYYDSFPLTIIVGKAKGGFTGLNLHYLPMTLRAKFLDELMGITNNKKYNDTTRFQASYELLNKAARFKYFKPCFKMYLGKHVRSRFAYVPPSEWEIATFLPTQDFQKASARTVYAESRKMI
jgi:hypothetical protein|tara:strand:+ start:9708 stop:10292 length:585 start_codon:yes stop_codon:yes gene_type:complete